jgi:hypothetical protein
MIFGIGVICRRLYSRREFRAYPLSVNRTVVNGANVSLGMYIDRLGKMQVQDCHVLPLKNFESGNTGAGTGVCAEGRTRTSDLCSAVLLVRGLNNTWAHREPQFTDIFVN